MESATNWHNPTDHEVAIVIMHPGRRLVRDESGHQREIEANEPERIVWQPGESKALPSVYDRVVHHVTGCDHPGCRSGICRDPGNAPATATIFGGLAPMLVRAEGQRYKLHASLVPSAQARTAEDAHEGLMARARRRRGSK